MITFTPLCQTTVFFNLKAIMSADLIMCNIIRFQCYIKCHHNPPLSIFPLHRCHLRCQKGSIYYNILQDIRDTNDMISIRRFTGLCPQHDILVDNMTCKEHLMLYASLKGVGDTNTIENEVSMVHMYVYIWIGWIQVVKTGSLDGSWYIYTVLRMV